VAGRIRLGRAHLVCRGCGAGGHPADDWLGVTGYLSPEVTALACHAAATRSFDRAADDLRRCCGLVVCDGTIRAAALAEAPRLADWQRRAPCVGERFRQAQGDIEFQADGTLVNTVEGGWREMRLGLFGKRPRGAPARPAQWDERDLPRATARVLFGGILAAEECGPLWRAWAGRLGIQRCEDVHLLADAARWIWKQQRENLPGAGGTLDIYHASQHLYGTARVLFGEGAAEVEPWVQARRRALLAGGAEALREELLPELHRRRGGKRKAVEDLLDFWEPHAEHSDYRGRLRRGQSIGSGQVEGACKTAVGGRLKQTGARWLLDHAQRMTALSCAVYGDVWDDYWEHKRAHPTQNP
jgi:hypothetical protein